MASYIKKHKKIFLFSFFSVIIFLIILTGILPFLLKSEWIWKNYFLPAIAQKTKCAITAEKISFSFFSPEKTLHISNLKIVKVLNKEKGEILSFHAEDARIAWKNKSLIDWKNYEIKKAEINSLPVKFQKGDAFFEQQFSRVIIEDLGREKFASFRFLTQLPVAAESEEKKLFPAEGKGKIFTGKNFQIREILFTLSGRKEKSFLLLDLSGKKDETLLWMFRGSLRADNIHTGTLFSFLHLKKFREMEITLQTCKSDFSFCCQKGENTLFRKTLSGTLSARTTKCLFPPELFAKGKNGPLFNSSLSFLQTILDKLVAAEKKALKNNTEKSAKEQLWKMQQYQQKTQLLHAILAGKSPLILHKGSLEIKIQNDFCTVTKGEFSADIPEKISIKGSLIPSTGNINTFEIKNKILDLDIPIYIDGGTWEKPQIDKKKTWKSLWKNNKRFLLSTGVKSLQKNLGSFITIDGKSLSDMPEEEAVKRSEELIRKKWNSLLKRLEKRARKKKRKNKIPGN